MSLSDLLKQLIIVAPHLTTFIKQVKYARRVLIHEVHHSLVVREFDLSAPFSESFSMKYCLLLLENVQDVKLMQLLVGVVDHHLFEAIHIEYFESVDI
jgi:hypothetical protein